MDNRSEANITRKEYWESFYSQELEQFQATGDEGEEWFGSEVEDIVQWVADLIPTRDSRVLDLGCGNGLMLLRLAERGFQLLDGCEYAASSIALAYQNITKKLEETASSPCNGGVKPLSHDGGDAATNKEFFNPSVEFSLVVFDLTQSVKSKSFSKRDCISDTVFHTGLQIVRQSHDPVWIRHKYDLIHDKGTFDVFFMRDEATHFLDALCRNFLKVGSIICVTSCNATEAELVRIFESHCCRLPTQSFPTATVDTSQTKFKKISNLSHRSFSFGGIQGQVVSSVAFKLMV